ncbi:MAG: bifunctional adenosylcobinamide kinase/adenosylcobinamide-phosphate guanylyltransferase [Spirochaetaceae bacterium]|nr:bifunctional adenosylcobinamide kinase/adenosylcobinamide-phosphate guanylyltransferase [Spirochaetaceae bacterium]
MELILGGYAQGKLDFAKSCYPDAVVFSEIPVDFGDDDVKIWDNFNISVKKMIESGKKDDDVRDMIQRAVGFHKNLVIISDEIGCGIIPMSADERHFREFIGRIQCFLAEKADKVFRVVCGIPQRIK